MMQQPHDSWQARWQSPESSLSFTERGHRVEYKYLVRRDKAVQLAEVFDTILSPDPFYGDCGEPYTVSTVYYDTSDYQYYHEKIEGEFSHRKARLRTYGPAPRQGPGYFEIKYKYCDDGYKIRIPLTGAGGGWVRGTLPTELVDLGWALPTSVPRVLEVLGPGPLFPVVHVVYERCAYSLRCRSGDELRVNIDTSIRAIDESGGSDAVFPHGEAVVEVKAPHRGWWPELAEILKMVGSPRATFSKYVSAVNVISSHYFTESPREF